jgi:1-acyl-sn-glycerol-3-phosphate acyltransferase
VFWLRIAGALAGFVAASVYGVAIALLRRDRSRVAADYARKLAAWIQPPLGMRVRVTGADGLSSHRPCVFIANHQSAVDVAVLASCFREGSVIIAKKEVGRIPFFGWIYRATGNLLIDRANTATAVEQLREAEAAVRARRAAVWIFPEGTRGQEPGRLLPFKKGGFAIAVHTGAPIVPVVVSPLKPDFDVSGRRLGPGAVEVRVLDPIPTAGLGDDDLVPLMETAHRRMEAALHDMGRALGRPVPPPTDGPRWVASRGPAEKADGADGRG